MEYRVKGIHHVTAIAGNAKRNLDFYTQVLGLRLVKKTVNFDDPGTYHFYFGNEEGAPGTILTFFPWEGVVTGKRGAGQVTETAFSVPSGALDFWVRRFQKHNVTYNNPAKRLNEEYLTFIDPDGLKMELVASDKDPRKPYAEGGIDEQYAIRGLYNVTLTVSGFEKTARVLTDIFGYSSSGSEVNRYRFSSGSNEEAGIVDIVDLPPGQTGQIAGGSVHHVAFRAENNEEQLYFRNKIAEAGFSPTPPIDRDYFMAVYFREPNGILFEIATNPPGFTRDEKLAQLGKSLKLPSQYESRRQELEQILPGLD